MAIEIVGKDEQIDGETLAERGDRTKREFESAFYDLIGFVLKEFKKCRQFMLSVDGFDKIPDDVLTYMHEEFSRRAKRYIETKKAFRKGGIIVSPDVGLS